MAKEREERQIKGMIDRAVVKGFDHFVDSKVARGLGEVVRGSFMRASLH